MKKTKIFLLISFLGTCITARSQEEFVEPPSQLLTRVHFTQLTGGVIMFNALLEDFPDTLNFILDSGSSGISLDSTTVAYFKLKPTPSDKSIRGIAGIKKVDFLYNKKLVLPHLVVDSLDFHINDYSILSYVYGERIDGIVGYSVLSRYIFKINYDSLYFDICSNGYMRYQKGGFLLRPTIGTLPVHFARLKDNHTYNTRLLHDIGAGVCLMLSKDFAEDSAILKRKRKQWIKEGAGVGGTIAMKITVISEIKLGPYRFRNIPTYIFNDQYNVTSYPYLGGLIGNDLLRRFNVIINYEKREIYLLPNSHFREPFDYAYSGLELYLVDGTIIVGNVAPGSPAEEAGLMEDDIVIGINNNLSQNFNQYKIALQQTNSKVKIILSRNGELMEIRMKIKSIL